MPSEKPSVITVSETQRKEIAASSAELHVSVEGTSLFTGQEALQKAREVANLVRGLTEYGLPPESIYLQGISADKYSGTLARTSHARYSLRIHCADLQILGDLIGIITGQKNVALTVIEWGYPDNDAQKDQWLQECITRVNEKAAKIAAALGVRLLGIHTFSEKYAALETPRRTAHAGEDMAMARSRERRQDLTSEDLGLEISHTKKVQVSVEIEYLVSEYAARAGVYSEGSESNIS